jgi:hypothetical protein
MSQRSRSSLLAGRNNRALTEHEIRQATATLVGLEPSVAYDYRADLNTCFQVGSDAGEEYGEIIIGPDVYPGRSVVDPNSMLGVKAAIAHELTHYHRWADRIELPRGVKHHLDEALTSLEAIGRYSKHLSELEVRQLVSDAIQRIYLYLRDELPEERSGA